MSAARPRIHVLRRRSCSGAVLSRLAEIVTGPMHASGLGRNLRRLMSAIDSSVRRFYGVTEFETEPDGALRIAYCQIRHDVVLSDATQIHANDSIIELHRWHEHFPRFPAEISDFAWPTRVEKQMLCTLHRLGIHIRRSLHLNGVCALRMNVFLSAGSPANALARLLLMAGFEGEQEPARRSCPPRFLDSLWVWLLTWPYNPRALTGWRFMRTRNQLWISRPRFLALHGDRLGRTKLPCEPATGSGSASF